ncbi:MAG: hypothetical protein M0C28_02510 [Candidatus Moduliflexus flocculans]|nr:hypothetical protein [Candidatus Moduliflexus flocculans]
MVRRNGGTVEGETVRLPVEAIKAVPLEVSFEGCYPVERRRLGLRLETTAEIAFEGTGYVLTGGPSTDGRTRGRRPRLPGRDRARRPRPRRRRHAGRRPRPPARGRLGLQARRTAGTRSSSSCSTRGRTSSSVSTI